MKHNYLLFGILLIGLVWLFSQNVTQRDVRRSLRKWRTTQFQIWNGQPQVRFANARSSVKNVAIVGISDKRPRIMVPRHRGDVAAIANGEVYAVEDRGGDYKDGQILFANASRFLETYFSEPLTNYATDWKDPNDIEGLLDFLAPKVPVGRRFEWKAATNAEEFLSETDDVRGIGADFKKVEYTGSDVTDKTLNKGLTYIADLDNVSGPNWENQKTAKLLRRLFRNEARRGITLISNAATNTAKTWSSGATNNPDQDIKTDLIAATTASGIRPNRVLYGDSAWNNRGLSYENVASTTTAFAGVAAMNPQQVAERLMVDQVRISKERYQSSSSAKSEVVGNMVYAWYAQDGVDTEDPTNFKRFVSQFDAEQGGGFIRVFVHQISSKLVAISVEHYSKIVATTTLGVRKWTIS